MKMKPRFAGILKAALTLMLILLLAAPYFAGCKSKSDNAAPENDASETNVQEQGVDEADIVKVNGAGLIFKAQKDGVTVSRMDGDGKIEIIKKKAAKGVTPLEMFLYKDRYLIVINAKVNVGQVYYNEDYYFNFNYDTMVVNIYDLEASAESSIALLRSDEFRGTYKTSRLTDGNVYLLTNYRRSYGEAYADYFGGNIVYNHFYYGDGGKNSYSSGGYLIAKLNLEEPREKYQTALYADNTVYDIYCSRYAFYAMKSKWIRNGRSGCGWFSYKPYRGYTVTAGIDRIDLDTLERTGTAADFNGWSPDRFCLYDNGGYLFVANQKMFLKNKDDQRGIGSYLYVFDKDMNEAAALGPVAPGETMYSARFDGGVCYIVTAKRLLRTVDPKPPKQTPTVDYPAYMPNNEPRRIYADPLFKIDLSDPLKPVLLGGLEIEGYSTYMQTFGDGLLIGLGRGEDGSELKISLFDVSKDTPAEVNSLLMAGGKAEAETEARAILCEPNRNVFAFAVRFDKGDMPQHGAVILGLDGDGELKQAAFLPEHDQNTDYSRKRIRRIARIGGHLLTVSDGYIASYLLSDVLENGVTEPVCIADTRIDDSDNFYTVKFVTGFENEGFSYPDRLVEEGYFTTIPKPADIENEWQFGHWSDRADGSSVYYYDEYYYDNYEAYYRNEYYYNRKVSYNLTLYIKWYKLPFRTVEFNLNRPFEITDQALQTAGISTPITLIIEDCGQVKSKASGYIGRVVEGYKLSHWYKDNPNVPYDFNAPVTDSFTLHAYWQSIITHKVTFEYKFPSGANYSHSTEVKIVENGTKVEKPSLTTCVVTGALSQNNTNYVLEYWYKDDPNTPYNFNSPVSESITLHAKWVKI